jgi:hypothetical protein
MKYSPKSYNKLIYEKGGFALIFETQIYELSQEGLVRKIKEINGVFCMYYALQQYQMG